MKDGGHNQFMGEDPRDRGERRDLEAPDGQTRAFSLEATGKEPPERCEERGAIRDLSAGVFIWRMLRPLLILIISVALVWFVGSFGYRYVVQNYVAPVEDDKSTVKTVEIKSGSSLSAIASLLHDESIIRNKLVFQLYVDFNDMSSKLQAGTYELSPGMTIDEIMETLVAGDGGKEILKITLTEGMTARDMAAVMVEKGLFGDAESREFLKLCNDTAAFDDYSFIADLPDTAQQDGRRYLLEGYLFPDTYEFYADATPEDVIRKLLDRFDAIFTLTYEERLEELGMTVDEVVTLASIIQWEAIPGDFKKSLRGVPQPARHRYAASVVRHAALRDREKKLAYLAEELAIESPYNTYQVLGLPVGPVSNPGQQGDRRRTVPGRGVHDRRRAVLLLLQQVSGLHRARVRQNARGAQRQQGRV